MNTAQAKDIKQKEIEEAAARLSAGGLVAFPTETVYGLGADAANAEAVGRVFALKGRPANHPIIVHLASAEKLAQWASDIPEEAFRLSAAFWPGPLTLILKRQPHVLDVVTGSQNTVGLRVPRHPVAQALLSEFGGGVAAPSANRFGHISPTTAAHVREEFGDAALVLDGGQSEVGVESTILDLSRGKPQVLRPGGVSLAELKRVLGYRPELGQAASKEVRVSGSLPQHYAPRTPAYLVELEVLEPPSDPRVGVIATVPKPAKFAGKWLNLSDDKTLYAQKLYAALRELDAINLDRILIEKVPEADSWLAVRDRLQRATASKSK